jgi:hypothetical protein
MKVRSSVIFGLGSSGAYVISNIERLLYEVVGNTRLDFLRMIAIDTDTTRKEDEAPPGGYRRQNLPIYENNLGWAMRNLRDYLGDHFDWCGTADIHIPGAGAGNLRGGGRLMLFNKLPDVRRAINEATAAVQNAVLHPGTEAQLRNELSQRGIAAPPGLIDANQTVVYTIGTLAGGTGSGSCVDFGYLIRDTAPNTRRIGIFFIPDGAAPIVFQENTWSVLKDLEYFCENPAAFQHAVWPSANRAEHPYRGGDGWPFDLVYLISESDYQKSFKLRYEPNARAPLVEMVALQVTADVLGMFEHRDSILSNLNAQVPSGLARHHMFLNFNLRAVCYPKYEISEAATCRVISDNICDAWLSHSVYQTPTGTSPIRDEDWRRSGRKYWNDQFNPIWHGAKASVDLAALTRRLLAGDVPEPEDNLRHQFSGNVQGTIYSLVAQQLPDRLRELQSMVKAGLATRLQETRSIRCAALFLEGLRQEMDYSQQYWTQLGVPERRDESAWTAFVATQVESLFRQKSKLAVVMLNARHDYVQDQLQTILNFLGMYLLRRTLAEFSEWMDRALCDWLDQLRRSLETIRNLARSRSAALLNLLNGVPAPVLRLTRSANVGFEAEIEEAANRQPETPITYLRTAQDGSFEGIFAITADQDAASDAALFLTLKNLLQPEYLRRLEEKGRVDIVQEVMAQNRVGQARLALKDAYGLSLATNLELIRAHTTVPSFVCARDTDTAKRLSEILQNNEPGLPAMQPKALPVFDHMAIFYQEGARLEPARLADAESYQRQYNRAMQDTTRRIELLDPLATVRQRAELAGHAKPVQQSAQAAASSAGPSPTGGAQ